MTSDETIEMAARVLFLSDRGVTLPAGFAERQWDEGYAVKDDYIRRARALADAGLIAPAPLREEWGVQWDDHDIWGHYLSRDEAVTGAGDEGTPVRRWVSDWEAP